MESIWNPTAKGHPLELALKLAGRNRINHPTDTYKGQDQAERHIQDLQGGQETNNINGSGFVTLELEGSASHASC